ncbi:N-acetyltransferase, partial [Burkholderia contaminans]
MSDLNPSRTLTYRPFAESDLPAAHRLSEAVKWPHRLEDWRFVLQLGGGFVAEDETGVVGTALGWRLGEAHAALGMLIVSPERAGGGIDRELLARALDSFGTRTVFLHAMPEHQPLYPASSFTGSYLYEQPPPVASPPPHLFAPHPTPPPPLP